VKHVDPRKCAASSIPEYRKALVLLGTLRSINMTDAVDLQSALFIPFDTTAGAMLNLAWPVNTCCHDCVQEFEVNLEQTVRQLVDHLEAVATAKDKSISIRYWTRLLDRVLGQSTIAHSNWESTP